jgi:hypothetical protein
MICRLPVIFFTLLLVLSFGFGVFDAESDIPVDRLYALYLKQVPTDADWERALPRQIVTRGGQKNEPSRLGDIDEDIVHTSTASCHHGSALPDPVIVDIRAFYTDQELFLRLEWDDATRDDRMNQWIFDGATWSSESSFEDGFGLLWDSRGTFPRFNCSYACHISDFGVSGDNFHARNKMQMARPDTLLDLWNWKAGRTGHLGFIDDRLIDEKGMRADLPGDLFRPNSTYFSNGSHKQPFTAGDSPRFDAAGASIESVFRVAGSTAPGYLTDRPVGSRADIAAYARYEDGRWIVILHRQLSTGDPKDVVFLPGDEAGVAFGLSLMDNTLAEHFASRSEERLVLMPREVFVVQGEE